MGKSAKEGASANLIGSLIAGLFVGVAMVKFGNPVIFANQIMPPQNLLEFIYGSWRIEWILPILLLVIIANITKVKFKPSPPLWLILLPLIWFVWQLIGSTATIDSYLTGVTLRHFFCCILCFYLAVFALKDVNSAINAFWAGIIIGFSYIISSGLDQHFGGLDELRANFEKTLSTLPPEQRKLLDTYEFRVKIMSNRIFSTFVYPNSFACALLLFTPPIVVVLNSILAQKNMRLVGALVSALYLIGSGLCLYWSGSKSAWVIAVGLISITLFRTKIDRKYKYIAIAFVLSLASALFIFKYSDYFVRGAKSASARLDYWTCALRIAAEHPVFGTGAGTFGVAYKTIKRPDAEMTRLTHNDYLQQASDSGVVAFLTYTLFIIGLVVLSRGWADSSSLHFAIWLGFLGWAIHSFFDFNLYIPGLAMPSFLFAGLIANRIAAASRIGG